MKKVDLTTGNVFKVIIALALPIMGSSFLQMSYGFINMLWVGHLDSDAIAEVGTSSFFVALGYAINSLVVVGAGVKIAHAIGEKKQHEINQYINVGLVINIIIGVLYAIILFLFGKYLIGFFDFGDAKVRKDAYIYLAMNGPILILAFFNMLFSRILGSFGNNKTALKIGAAGIILNMILDPVLIYGLHMGIFGAAIATLLGNLLMTILYIVIKGSPFRYYSKEGIDFEKVKIVFKIGTPIAIQRTLFTLVNIVLGRFISVFGADAIAGQRVGIQLESLNYRVMGGLNGAMSSYVGQNYGAKKIGRIKEGYIKTVIVGTVYGLFVAALFMGLSKELVEIFIPRTPSTINTIKIASSYLFILGISQPFSAIEIISNGMFTGVGLPKIPAKISIICTVLRIPVAIVLMKYFGVNGIFISISLSSVVKGVIVVIAYRVKILKGKLKEV
ncbi:MAG: MATE family efflux transporter [Sarcina sp.]